MSRRVLACCRVCLSREINMYAIADTPLQAVYEKLTGSELQTQDARPAWVCYICLHQLRQCDSLIRRAVGADTFLGQLAAKFKAQEAYGARKPLKAETEGGLTNMKVTVEHVKSDTDESEMDFDFLMNLHTNEEEDDEDGGESSTDRRELDAEAEDEAAESADADNTSENSARQNAIKFNEKTCENQMNKGPPFLIIERLNITLQNKKPFPPY